MKLRPATACAQIQQNCGCCTDFQTALGVRGAGMLRERSTWLPATTDEEVKSSALVTGSLCYPVSGKRVAITCLPVVFSFNGAE